MDKVDKIRAEIKKLRQKVMGVRTDFADGQKGVLTELLSFIDSMQNEPKKCMYSKDNYTEEDRKALCEGCEEECEFAKKEPVSNNYSALLPCVYNRTLEERVKYCKYCSVACEGRVKEPVSEDLEKAAVEAFKQIVDSDKNNFLEIFKAGAKWQLAKNKSITLDDLEKFINELSKQFPEVSFAKVCKIATRTAKWQKKQMMAKAINTKASLIMSVPSICISLPLGVNVGDKVKVIVIKEG